MSSLSASLSRLSTTDVLGLVLCLALAGCATKPEASSPVPLPPLDAEALEVRLAFDANADLDLFVTDPARETVYFGNNPSLGGGHLLADVRCATDRERVEIVRFARPRPGRYRVGVEYARACRFRREPSSYRIEIRGPGLDLQHEGTLGPGRFEPIALEFDVGVR